MKNQRDTNKAISAVVGFLMIVVILTMFVALYQLTYVPIQEENKEVEHFEEVSSQMQNIRSAVLSTSADSQTRSQQVNLGVDYGEGFIGIAPVLHGVNPAGTIQTQEFGSQIKIRNAQGLGSASNFWPGIGDPCSAPNHCFDTSYLTYNVNYQHFSTAPSIRMENGILYDSHQGRSGTQRVLKSTQPVVNGRTISLVMLDGNLDKSQVSPTSIQAIPVSAPAQTIAVKGNETDKRIKINIPTNIPIEKWRNDLLNDQLARNNSDGFVKNITNGPGDTIVLTMVKDQEYNLELSKVFLTSTLTQEPVPKSQPAYVAWQGNSQLTIKESTVTQVPVQVRDRYNNPKTGVRTKAYARDENGQCVGNFRSARSASCDGRNQPGIRNSGENGRTTYYYDSPDVNEDTQVSLRVLLDPRDRDTLSHNPNSKKKLSW